MLLDDHVTVLSVALSGFTVAVGVSTPSGCSERDVLLRVMLLTFVTEGVTVTVQVLESLELAGLTVIVAVPCPLAVTTPELLTVATLVLLLEYDIPCV